VTRFSYHEYQDVLLDVLHREVFGKNSPEGEGIGWLGINTLCGLGLLRENIEGEHAPTNELMKLFGAAYNRR
jgi:hypothetical protein